MLSWHFVVMLLQKAMPVQEVNPAADFTTGNKIVAFLLSSILALLLHIWNQSQKSTASRHAELKELAEKRHEATLQLFKELDVRQDKLEKQHHDHKWELHGFRGFINKIQGKDFEYDNPRPDRHERE